MRNKWQEARDIVLARRKQRPMQVSVVLSTYNKARLLQRTLDSIFRQRVPFNYEVIVVDDGSQDDTPQICSQYEIVYHRVEREPSYRNPGPARNIGYKLAKGKIVIAQSDDVVHESLNTIEVLSQVPENEFWLASVRNAIFSESGICTKLSHWYVGKRNPRPLFFLGSVHRKAIYRIGGNHPALVEVGYDDDLFSLMLQKNGLSPIYRDDILGLHQHHSRPNLRGPYSRMEAVYQQIVEECERTGVWRCGEPWIDD